MSRDFLPPQNLSERRLVERKGVLELSPAAAAIRAEVVRALILDEEAAPCGVRLRGARISGALDLQGARVPRWLDLTGCVFEQPPLLRGAAFDGITLDRAALPGLRASRLSLRADLRLKGVRASGEIRLRRAAIGGNLIAVEARLAPSGAVALDADGAAVGGTAFLSNVEAQGAVRMLDARIDRHLACIGASFRRPGARALRLEGARIGGTFFLRRGARIEGALDLRAARIGAISDDPECWPAPGDLLLNRCVYGGFTGGPVDAETRLRWLARGEGGARGGGFRPQPYVQLAAVLAEMGLEAEARRVRVERERRQRGWARAALAERLAQARGRVARAMGSERRLAARAPLPMLQARLACARLSDALLGAVIGFGHRPARALLWAAGVWLVGAGVFQWAWSHDAMKPDDPRIAMSREWSGCRGRDRIACFLATPGGAGFPRFEAFTYSLDALAPVIDLGQDSVWRPADETARGRWARRYQLAHALAGWALTLLGVAGVSGLVKKD